MSDPTATIEQRALETIHGRARAEIRVASPAAGWDDIAASRFRQHELAVHVPALGVQSIGINYGEAVEVERTIGRETLSGRGTPGHIALVPPDAESRWTLDRRADLLVIHLSQRLIDRAVAESAGGQGRRARILPRFLIRDLTIERIGHELLHEMAAPRLGTRPYVRSLAQELAVHLVRFHSSLSEPPEGQRYAMSPQRLARAKAFIEANLAGAPLQEIAAVVGMSPFYFAKSFKQATGRPPHQYLTERRIERARSLLHDRTLSIAQIAHAVGLQSQSHFTALFARQMGMTPRQFRNVLRS